MELLSKGLDIFLHLDRQLQVVTTDYGMWTYLILFWIIFMETGLVVTPFLPGDVLDLSVDAPGVVKRRVPGYETEYARRGWRMFPSIDRVYVNERARRDLGWRPRYDFRYLLDRLASGRDAGSPLSRAVGSKGYHAEKYEDGPYPVP